MGKTKKFLSKAIRIGVVACFVISCFALNPTPAMAAEISLGLVADTYIDRDFPTQNYGTENRLDAHYGSVPRTTGRGVDYIMREVLLRFDHADLTSIPAGATINSAALEMYLDTGAGNAVVYVDIGYITQDWNETDATWNSLGQSVAYPRNPRITSHVGTSRGWYEWDVTRIVRNWRSGSTDDYGLRLSIYLEAGTPIEDYSRIFYSKEGSSTRKPRLTVDYTTAPPTTDVDLTITNLEINQAIQVIDDPTTPTPGVDNSVPLIADKPTIVRLYVDNGPATESVHGVTAHLYRVVGGVEERTYPLAPIVAVEAPDRENHHHTINFRLPSDWLQGDMDLYAVINPSTLSMRVEETDYGNNRYPAGAGSYIPISFEAEGRSVDIAWLRVNYTWPGWTGANLARDRVGQREAVDFIRAVYPVASQNVTYYPWPEGGFDWDQDVNHNYGSDLRAELNNLYDLSTISPKPDFLYAWIPETSYGWVGLSDPPYNGGAAIVAFGEDRDPNLLYRVIFTHELGHNLNQTGHYDLPNARLTGGEFGYDVINIDPLGRIVMRHYIDAGGTPQELIDFMRGGSSPHAVRDGNHAWVTPHTYRGINTEMTASGFYGTPDSPAWQEEYERSILISGLINRKGFGEFRPFYVLTDRVPDQPREKGEYSVELLDSKEKVISVFNFDVDFKIDNYAGKEVTIVSFSHIMPYPDSTKLILLKHKDEVYDKVEVSPNAPKVEIISPVGGEKLSGAFTVKWEASDEDGDPLTYSVLYSKDGGETWLALVTGITKTAYELNADGLPGSRNAYIRVMATDGVNTTVDDTDEPLIIENKKPTASIIKPEDNAHFTSEDTVLFTGQGYDLEDGAIEDQALLWASNRDGYLGSGRLVKIDKLSAGVHTVTLIALDSEGSAGTDSITVVVRK